MKFRATIKQSGRTATGIEVPPEVVACLGSSKRPAVQVTLNGYGYRSSVASMGGKFMLPVSAEHRAGAGVAAGDTEPREVTVPPDLSDALDRDTDARRFFDGLSYSSRLRHVLAIVAAKTPETRQRRITKTVGLMHDGRS